MIGAVFGDIVGSKFEWNNIKTNDFDLFQESMIFTDDSVMTIALSKALMEYVGGNGKLQDLAVKNMRLFGKKYPNAGYGERFKEWLKTDNPQPYNSFGNGAAMRVSACGWVGKTLDEVKQLSYDVTVVTHNHLEGLKGAEATAVAIFMARIGKSKDEIKQEMQKYYSLTRTLAEIRENYGYDVSCQGTVPPAIQAFLEAKDFEDAIRNAISLGGDSDTLAAITGSIAEAYFGVKERDIEFVKSKLDWELWDVLSDFANKFNAEKIE